MIFFADGCKSASDSNTPFVTDGDNSHQLRTLLSSLKNAARAVKAVIAAQNAFSLLHKLPPEIIITISKFIMEPRSRGSMLKLVKMTHIVLEDHLDLIPPPVVLDFCEKRSQGVDKFPWTCISI